MSRLVDVDELKHELKWLEEYDSPVYHDVASTIDEMATVDTETVVRCADGEKGEKMRLIDADELKEHFPKDEDWEYPVHTNSGVVEIIDDAPTIDHVKHGEWRYDEALDLEWCSECEFGKRKGDKRWYSYCPNCGCKMEVEDVQESD